MLHLSECNLLWHRKGQVTRSGAWAGGWGWGWGWPPDKGWLRASTLPTKSKAPAPSKTQQSCDQAWMHLLLGGCVCGGGGGSKWGANHVETPPAFLHTFPHHCKGVMCIVAIKTAAMRKGFQQPDHHPKWFFAQSELVAKCHALLVVTSSSPPPPFLDPMLNGSWLPFP